MDLCVHLKFCEACGCLWYRSQFETSVYCTSCNERFKEFPTPQSRKRRGRPRKTILPTVFAVHAPEYVRNIEQMAFPEGAGAFRPLNRERRSKGALAPETTLAPFALLASRALSNPALSGGAL